MQQHASESEQEEMVASRPGVWAQFLTLSMPLLMPRQNSLNSQKKVLPLHASGTSTLSMLSSLEFPQPIDCGNCWYQSMKNQMGATGFNSCHQHCVNLLRLSGGSRCPIHQHLQTNP
jgi:hypothetical protein